MIQAIYEELSGSQGSGRRPRPAQATTIPSAPTAHPGNDNTLQPKGAEE